MQKNVTEFVRTIHGSHLYGLNTENSDLDYKGIFIPNSRKELWLGTSPKHLRSSTGGDTTKNSAGDIDIESFSLHTFFEMCQRGEMIAIDMLHTPNEFVLPFSNNFCENLWNEIRSNRSKFYSKDMRAYIGYIRKQTAKYGLKGSRMNVLEEILAYLKPYFKDENNVKYQRIAELRGNCRNSLPQNEYCRWYDKETPSGTQTFYEVLGKSYQSTSKTFELYESLTKIWDNYGERARLAKDNKGVDWKAVSHAVRAAYQSLEIYETGNIRFPLRQRDLILDIKLGKMDFESEVSPMLDMLTANVEKLSKESNYPDTPDRVWWENLLVDVYEKETT